MAQTVLIPGCVAAFKDDVAHAVEKQGYEARFMGNIVESDIDMGQSYIDNDVCVAAIGTIGQCVRYLRNKPEYTKVLVPEVCKDCRACSLAALLPDALHRAGIDNIEIVPMSCAELSSCIGAKSAEVPESDKPVIGVCGNAVVLSTPLFNRTVVEHLSKSGCEVVMPPLNILVNEQDFLVPCIEWFASQGIKSVICILAFGCLGGHAYARGKARVLRERFSDVELTLLDYDPSASDINVVNRTELVIQSAKDRSGDTRAVGAGSKRSF